MSKYNIAPRFPIEHLIVGARTIFAEARSEPEDGQFLVAAVIINRVYGPRWMGSNILKVCKRRWAFSCWNPETVGHPPDKNYVVMTRAKRSALDRYIDMLLQAEQDFRESVGDSAQSIPQDLRHYLNVEETKKIRGGTLPSWYYKLDVWQDVGRHTFLRG